MKNTIKIILASLPVVLVMSALTAAEERPYAGGHGGAGDAPPVTIEQTGPPQQKAIYREIHPPVRFLDRGGQPVVESGGALSFMKTCGQCHAADNATTLSSSRKTTTMLLPGFTTWSRRVPPEAEGPGTRAPEYSGAGRRWYIGRLHLPVLLDWTWEWRTGYGHWEHVTWEAGRPSVSGTAAS